MSPYGDMFKGLAEMAMFGAVCACILAIGGVVGIVAGIVWLFRHASFV